MMDLKLSCPAVSHICNLTLNLSSILITFEANYTPDSVNNYPLSLCARWGKDPWCIWSRGNFFLNLTYPPWWLWIGRLMISILFCDFAFGYTDKLYFIVFCISCSWAKVDHNLKGNLSTPKITKRTVSQQNKSPKSRKPSTSSTIKVQVSSIRESYKPVCQHSAMKPGIRLYSMP